MQESAKSMVWTMLERFLQLSAHTWHAKGTSLTSLSAWEQPVVSEPREQRLGMCLLALGLSIMTEEYLFQ